MKFIDYVKDLAIREAAKSLANKRKVGAVIANMKTEVIVSVGHNHNPTGESCEDVNGNTVPEVIHAEVAALKNLVVDIKEAIDLHMFVTHQPCENCAAALKQANMSYTVVENFLKFDTGKLRYSLVPPVAMKAMAEVLTYGAKKYKPYNWTLVDNEERYIDALYRHLEAWRAGELLDKESGLSHLSHAITNVAFLLHFEEKENDNNSTIHTREK